MHLKIHWIHVSYSVWKTLISYTYKYWSPKTCVCVHACVSTSAVPRGFLAAVVVLVRVDAVERADVAVLLVAVAAVPFLVAAEEPVWFEVAVLAFGTRGRFSAVVWGEGENTNTGDDRWRGAGQMERWQQQWRQRINQKPSSQIKCCSR